MVIRNVDTSDRYRSGKAQRAQVMAVGTRLASLVSSHVGGKCREGTADEADGAVGVPARPAAAYLVESAPQPRHDIGPFLAPGQAGQVIGDSGKSENARTALPRTLIGQESSDAG
jgi:hypothetical protein